MVIIFGVVQVILICFILYNEFKNKSPVVFLWGTLLAIFGIINFIYSIFGNEKYSDVVVLKASVFSILFCLLYIATRHVCARKVAQCLREKLSYDNIYKYIAYERVDKFLFIFIVLWFVKYIPFLIFSGGIYNSSWSSGRDYAASLDYVNFTQFVNVIMFAISGVIAVYVLKKQYKLAIWFSFFLIIGVLLSRNRIEILPLFCSLLAVLIFKIKKISTGKVILSVVSVALIFYIVYAIRVFRHYGDIENFIHNFSLIDFNEIIFSYFMNGNGELGLLNVFYYFIDNDGFYGFNEMASYIRMLLVYVPTQWSMGIKPEDFAICMGQAIGMPKGGSVHPTLYGDCYANAEFLGVLLGIFWAIFATFIDLTIIKVKSMISSLLIFVVSSVCFCIIGRGSVYNSFWLLAYTIPVIIIFNNVSIKFCHINFK